MTDTRKRCLQGKLLTLLAAKIDFPYTEEAGLARAHKMTYKQAVEAIYARRHALSTMSPFSASVWGSGNGFVYGQGVLCVLQGQTVRLSDLRLQSRDLHLDLAAIVEPVLGLSVSSSPRDLDLELLNYSEGILAVHVTQGNRADGGYIVVLNVAHGRCDNGRVIQIVRLTSSSKLFVRHTIDFLYYGTHTGRGNDGHHKWEIGGICLNKRMRLPDGTKRLLLDNFHGSDIGSTVAFEIHGGYFYAVSNQGTFEVEEIDYTSFYHVVRFPIDSPLAASVERDERLYRRQHRQGPIHDSWTDLTLQRDERTNETVIVESRREWAEASSRQSRTFYVTKLEFGTQDSTREFENEVMLPEDDIYLPVIDSSNKPQWKPTPDLFSWSQHTEFCSADLAPRSFMLARTKFRAYNYGCTTFLDLVEDESCCNDASKPPCLRLRVGSRREIGLDDSLSDPKGKTPVFHMTRPTFVDSGTRYRQSPIRMWPPRASRCPCSQRLHDILNPALSSSEAWYTRSVTGVLDDQRLVVMVKAGRSYGSGNDKKLGTVIVVDFSRSTNNSTSAQSVPAGPARSDDEIEQGPNLEWKWTPGPERRCKAGTCGRTTGANCGS